MDNTQRNSVKIVESFKMLPIDANEGSFPNFKFEILLKKNVHLNDSKERIQTILANYNVRIETQKSSITGDKIILTTQGDKSIKFLNFMGIRHDNGILTSSDKLKINFNGETKIDNGNSLVNFSIFQKNFNVFSVGNDRKKANNAGIECFSKLIEGCKNNPILGEHSLIKKLHNISLSISKEDNIFTARIEATPSNQEDRSDIIEEFDTIFKNFATPSGTSIEIDSTNLNYTEFLAALGITREGKNFVLDGKNYNNHTQLQNAFNGQFDEKRVEKLEKFSDLLNFYSHKRIKADIIIPQQSSNLKSNIDTFDTCNIDTFDTCNIDTFKQILSCFEKFLAFFIKLFCSTWINKQTHDFLTKVNIANIDQVSIANIDQNKFNDEKNTLLDKLNNECFFKITKKIVLNEIYEQFNAPLSQQPK